MDKQNFFLKKMLRFMIFYVLLQTASSAIEYGYDIDLDDAPDISDDGLGKHKKYNDILSNLHGLFKRRTLDDVGNGNTNEDNDNSMIQINDQDKIQFNRVIADVSSALDKIKAELIKFNNDGVITVGVPVDFKDKRHKRDLSNETETVTDIVPIDDNVTESNELTSEIISETTTENIEVVTAQVEAVTEKTETLPDKPVARTTNANNVNTTEDSVSGRRMMPEIILSTNSRVKNKLLSYLEDTFNEVERKIKPLTNIKIALSNDDHYRIGYIIATIDTLEVNLKKLKTDMNLHQQTWGDEKILDLFDRIKATNTVTTTLIETLKKYLPKPK